MIWVRHGAVWVMAWCDMTPIAYAEEQRAFHGGDFGRVADLATAECMAEGSIERFRFSKRQADQAAAAGLVLGLMLFV